LVKNLIEMFLMDDRAPPNFSDINSFLREAVRRGYIEENALKGLNFKNISFREILDLSAGLQPAKKTIKIEGIEGEILGTPTAYRIPHNIESIRSPGTTLYLTKEGNDIRLNWTGTGTLYDCAIANDVQYKENVRTIFLDLSNTTYLYKNGLINGEEFICFDVTDEVEQNRGGNWNGGILPPPPPEITSIEDPSNGSSILYIGGDGKITGSNFSSVLEENKICFEDGVCIYPDTGTETELTFKVPPGAKGGNLYVMRGLSSSDVSNASINLEPINSGWLIRTMGYSKQGGDFWFAGYSGGTNSIYRVYYNSLTGKWEREDKAGGMGAQLLYCSTKTDSNGRLFCGLGSNSTGGGGTRYVETSPPGTLQNCINLGGSGDTTQVRGAAVDGVRGYAYFAHYNVTQAKGYVKKINTSCSSVLDSDYGNMGG